MTRKDYVLIAEAFKAEIKYWPRSHSPEAATALDCIGERLANALAQDNPRFDRQRFIEACQLDAERLA